jgi:hypothetical protein
VGGEREAALLAVQHGACEPGGHARVGRYPVVLPGDQPRESFGGAQVTTRLRGVGEALQARAPGVAVARAVGPREAFLVPVDGGVQFADLPRESASSCADEGQQLGGEGGRERAGATRFEAIEQESRAAKVAGKVERRGEVQPSEERHREQPRRQVRRHRGCERECVCFQPRGRGRAQVGRVARGEGEGAEGGGGARRHAEDGSRGVSTRRVVSEPSDASYATRRN